MELSRNNFEVLNHLRKQPGSSQRDISAATGLSLGTVNKAVKQLGEESLINAGEVTPQGYEMLHPYKVDNAIILAAGLSSRFVPISYEKPKGLLRVRGEILIERQIEQLRAAGISDITVVVGYKKEYFFYLESKYGVKIVVNDEFASRNNHASLMRVRYQLGNSFICCSDDYFTENPFESYVYKAYYAAQWADGPTKEWCMKTGSQGRITSVTVGGSNSWYMMGHVYFDRTFSKRFVEILEQEYDRPETADKLWEELYIEHIDELDMTLRQYPAGVINEFDSLDELRDFDPHFIQNVDSEIFDNIVEVLGCDRSEIRDVYPLKQGLTNLSCHFATDSGEYVYRHPGVGTELLIDRKGEVAAQKVAKEIGLDGTFIFEDSQKGWKISRFIPNCRNMDPANRDEVAQVMNMGRRLHEAPVKLDRYFDFYDESQRYKSLLLEKGPIDIPGFKEMSDKFDRLARYMRADNAPICLCHNDFFSLNVLIDEQDTYYLIDWEYAGMGDYANDFGTFCVCCQLPEDGVSYALEAYFEREPTEAEARHNLGMIAMAGWCWYLWSLLKEAEGDYVGEWLYIYFNYAQKYIDRSLESYELARE